MVSIEEIIFKRRMMEAGEGGRNCREGEEEDKGGRC